MDTLKKRNLKRETEFFFIAKENNALRINYVKTKKVRHNTIVLIKTKLSIR